MTRQQYQNSRKEKSISLTQIYDRSLPWLGTDTSIKSGGVKLIVWAHTSPLLIWSVGWFMVFNATFKNILKYYYNEQT
jgi:hypothetical protein